MRAAGVCGRCSGTSDDWRLQDLRDSQLLAECHESKLCAQAPAFVPGPFKPINFMTKATK